MLSRRLAFHSFLVPWLAWTLVGTASAQTLTESAVLVPGDVSAGDYLGESVALSGDTALVGAMRSAPGGELAAGAAYVFVRDGATWTQQAKLVADDGAPDDVLGCSVALAGDTALVGAMGDDANAGAAYVFVRTGTTWTQQAKLVAPDRTANDRFGWSVSLDGDTAVAGAPQDSRHPGVAAGSAHVFVRVGTSWTHQAKLEAAAVDGEYLFGRSVALSGETLVVGAPWEQNAGGPDAGAAYVFVRAGSAWTRQAKLVASDAGAFDKLGLGVALSGDTALVGAYFESHDGITQAGSAYVFVRAGSAWTQQAKLVASDAGPQDLFGCAVGLADDIAVVGANYADGSGAAYTYARPGGEWIQQAKLVFGDAAPGDIVGGAVAVSSRTAVVGASGSDRSGPASGAAGVFELPSTFVLGFETEDDSVTPLVNGQHLDTEFGSLATLASSGANAGLAIFDSTTGGPNDPSQDLDLLVGTGNVLILQTENFPPDANDVFPRPNDDEDGGSIVFDFVAPFELRSVRLVDVDAGDGTSAIVLEDGGGRRRTYSVPGNWTGDRTLGAPGHGVLDLTTLAPQAGFGSVATAVEEPGFEPVSVVRMEVHLAGSGALDDVVLSWSSPPRAAVTARNGSGSNPASLTSTSRPVLGGIWTASLECAGSQARALVDARRLPAAGTFTPFGEVLVAGALLRRTRAVPALSRATFAWEIPRDLSLLGLELHVQGLCTSGTSGGGKLAARSGTLSNALDLVLGF